MSAPDYKDPSTKLKLRLRPMPGSSAFLALGAGIGALGAIVSAGMFLVSFLPNITVDGDQLGFALLALLFAAGAAIFNAVRKVVRRMR